MRANNSSWGKRYKARYKRRSPPTYSTFALPTNCCKCNSRLHPLRRYHHPASCLAATAPDFHAGSLLQPGLHPRVAQRHFAPALLALAAASGKKLCASHSKFAVMDWSPGTAGHHATCKQTARCLESQRPVLRIASGAMDRRNAPHHTIAAGTAKPASAKRIDAKHDGKKPGCSRQCDAAHAERSIRKRTKNGSPQYPGTPADAGATADGGTGNASGAVARTSLARSIRGNRKSFGQSVSQF